MAIAPWNALGGGKFQSKAAIEERKKQGEGMRSMMGNGDQTEQQVKMSEALEEVANEHKDATVTAVALAYALQAAPYVFPVSVRVLHDDSPAVAGRLTSLSHCDPRSSSEDARSSTCTITSVRCTSTCLLSRSRNSRPSYLRVSSSPRPSFPGTETVPERASSWPRPATTITSVALSPSSLMRSRGSLSREEGRKALAIRIAYALSIECSQKG